MAIEDYAAQYGIAGLLILVWFILQRERDKRSSTTDDKKLDIEAQKVAAMKEGFTSLARKIDDHHTSDLEAHAELSSNQGRIEGKLDAIHGFTPVRGVPKPSGERKPSRGEFHDGEDE